MRDVPRDTKTPWLVFTDLDGTLLDARTYSAGPAREALARLQALEIPVILCSSKTAAEQRAIRAELGLVRAPFIVENGAAIIVPADAHLPVGDWPAVPGEPTERVYVLASSAAAVRAAIGRAAKSTGTKVTGYSDLTSMEIAELTGLDPAAADRARQRDYSETLVGDFSSKTWDDFEAALLVEGGRSQLGGRFRTIAGLAADKGQAVRIVAGLYHAASGQSMSTAGLGDSANDASLLAAVDRPYLVQRPDRTWAPINASGLRRIAQPGPQGWREAVFDLLTGG